MSIRHAVLGVCVLVLGAPAPALAQDVFTPPEGCAGTLTVQQKSCTVSNHFTCERDPEGHRRRADFDEEGLTYAGRIDSETQWLESFRPGSDGTEVLEDDPVDRASFSELLETGVDSYDFETVDPDGGRTRFAGADRLTGEEVEIDGVTLRETDFAIKMYDEAGGVLWESTGREYIHPELRIFLSGVGTTRLSDQEPVEEDGSPVEFVFPGEKGFMSARPKFGCGAVDAGFGGGG